MACGRGAARRIGGDRWGTIEVSLSREGATMKKQDLTITPERIGKYAAHLRELDLGICPISAGFQYDAQK